MATVRDGGRQYVDITYEDCTWPEREPEIQVVCFQTSLNFS